MRTVVTGILVAGLALLPSACFEGSSSTLGSNYRSTFAEAIPGPEDVELRVPGDPNPNALTLGETAAFYSETYRITHDINGFVYVLLSVLRDVVALPPTQYTEDQAIWGPFTGALEPVTYVLVVNRVGENDYEYALLGRPRTSTSDDDFEAIIGGQANPASGAEDGEGRGSFVIDWTTFASLDPNIDLLGRMTVHYNHRALSWRSVEMFFEDLRGRGWSDSAEPTDVLYRYLENDDTSGDFQFAYRANLHEGNPTRPEPEIVRIRSRWSRPGAGRSDVQVHSSEIAADLETFLGLDQDYVAIAECWDDGFLRVYYDESPVRLTPDDGVPPMGSFDGPGQGNIEDCVFPDSLFADDDVDVM